MLQRPSGFRQAFKLGEKQGAIGFRGSCWQSEDRGIKKAAPRGIIAFFPTAFQQKNAPALHFLK
jgi:hypothetical protein